jgi:uncharacterized protein (DUF1015 family)
VFIADGHHRYETSLNYRRELSAESPIAADYILITLTAFEDEGLLVLPTHRLVRNVPPEKIAALPSALSSRFTLSEIAPESIEEAIAAQAAQGKVAFGIVLPPGQAQLAVLEATEGDQPGPIPGPGSEVVQHLPVTLLGTLILDQGLGIDAAAVAAGTHVSYTRDLAEAFAAVKRGDAQAAFLLGRPTVEEVRDVSLAGDVMPQKSTFFYPKLLSGLVLRDLRLDNPAEAMQTDAE